MTAIVTDKISEVGGFARLRRSALAHAIALWAPQLVRNRTMVSANMC
jgi:hypothetical protein